MYTVHSMCMSVHTLCDVCTVSTDLFPSKSWQRSMPAHLCRFAEGLALCCSYAALPVVDMLSRSEALASSACPLVLVLLL